MLVVTCPLQTGFTPRLIQVKGASNHFPSADPSVQPVDLRSQKVYIGLAPQRRIKSTTGCLPMIPANLALIGVDRHYTKKRSISEVINANDRGSQLTNNDRLGLKTEVAELCDRDCRVWIDNCGDMRRINATSWNNAYFLSLFDEITTLRCQTVCKVRIPRQEVIHGHTEPQIYVRKVVQSLNSIDLADPHRLIHLQQVRIQEKVVPRPQRLPARPPTLSNRLKGIRWLDAISASKNAHNQAAPELGSIESTWTIYSSRRGSGNSRSIVRRRECERDVAVNNPEGISDRKAKVEIETRRVDSWSPLKTSINWISNQPSSTSQSNTSRSRGRICTSPVWQQSSTPRKIP
mmetsp:Transcript_37812/g.100461  ORF Transcript_37812/g.100461 Transcript_37812/m.100461 type:complete len:348 (+) Transcript_37812:291-1334(+)